MRNEGVLVCFCMGPDAWGTVVYGCNGQANTPTEEGKGMFPAEEGHGHEHEAWLAIVQKQCWELFLVFSRLDCSKCNNHPSLVPIFY